MLPRKDRLRLLESAGVFLLVLSISRLLDKLSVSGRGFLLVLGLALGLDELASSASLVEKNLFWRNRRIRGRSEDVKADW
jgi:hypothetical protein